jgi:hypothetical protein
MTEEMEKEKSDFTLIVENKCIGYTIRGSGHFIGQL